MSKGKFDGRKTSASVKRHAIHDGVWVGIVETPSSRVYSCLWRRDEPPTPSEVLDAWKAGRADFDPGD